MDAKLKMQLDRLPELKLREVRSYLSARLAHGLTKKGRADDDIAMLFIETICEVMRSRGLDMTTPPMLMGKAAQFREFRRKLELDGLAAFLRRAVKRNRVKLRALIYLSVELLLDDLKKMPGIAVSATTVMNYSHRIPAVLDLSFPGYATAGMLHMVIREEAHARPQRSDETVSRRKRPHPARE